jgi:hypothetical protein
MASSTPVCGNRLRFLRDIQGATQLVVLRHLEDARAGRTGKPEERWGKELRRVTQMVIANRGKSLLVDGAA